MTGSGPTGHRHQLHRAEHVATRRPPRGPGSGHLAKPGAANWIAAKLTNEEKARQTTWQSTLPQRDIDLLVSYHGWGGVSRTRWVTNPRRYLSGFTLHVEAVVGGRNQRPPASR